MPNTLLALSARAQSHPVHLQRLSDAAQVFTAWEALPEQAERQGVSPLLYKHLQAVIAPVPALTRRSLQGLYVRHRRANMIRLRVLGEIIRELRAAGIETLVLKGAALAQWVYPEPGLRPMSDLDLLTRPAEAHAALARLARLGFQLDPALPKRLPKHHHFEAAQLMTEGLTVNVEVHHTLLFPQLRVPPLELDDLLPTAHSLTLNGLALYTLGREAMLRHIYQHAFRAHVLDNKLCLMWVADLISAVEQWVNDLDWSALRRQDPELVYLLALLNDLTPWSSAVLEKIQPEIHAHSVSVGGFDWRKISPPDWWLVLQYGTKGWRGLTQHWQSVFQSQKLQSA